jgi:hypothetical protein
MIRQLVDLRELNIRGSLQGYVDGPLVPYDALARPELLEELDISSFKVSAKKMGRY